MTPDAKIYVAGHTGLVGSAIARALTGAGHTNLLTRRHADLDLTSQEAVEQFFASERPDYVFLAAAKVGGIVANDTFPAEFIGENLAIQTNVIRASRRTGVKRLLFLGSSCIYPRDCPQPMKEEHLLSGPLEATNRPYAIAKIAGIEMCWAYNRQYGTRYLAAMPTNMYGPRDNYDLETSHVLPALIRKMHEGKERNAPEVVIWGTGEPRREFLFSDDLGQACVFLMSLPDENFQGVLGDDTRPPLINIGSGEDQTIRELAEIVRDVVDYRGRFRFDTSRPDGTPRKLLSNERMTRLGWRPRIPLRQGIALAYEDHLRRVAAARA